MRATALTLCALSLLILTGAPAAQTVTPAQDITGQVVRIDPAANVVVLDNGQMYQATPSTVFLVDNQPVALTAIQPGTAIVVRSAQPVIYQNGTYVVTPSGAIVAPSTTVAALPSPSSTTVVVQPGVAAAVPTVINGRVASVDQRTNMITFADGRAVMADSKAAISINGQPITIEQVRPGVQVAVATVNPVLYRDGRSAVLNPGFYDSSNGSALTWDSRYAGYEGDSANAAMQPQAP